MDIEFEQVEKEDILILKPLWTDMSNYTSGLKRMVTIG